MVNVSRMVRCQGVNQDGQLCLLREIWKNKIGVSIGKLIHVLFNDVCRHQLSPYLSYFLLPPLHFGPNGSDVMSADHGFNQIVPYLFVYPINQSNSTVSKTGSPGYGRCSCQGEEPHCQPPSWSPPWSSGRPTGSCACSCPSPAPCRSPSFSPLQRQKDYIVIVERPEERNETDRHPLLLC